MVNTVDLSNHREVSYIQGMSKEEFKESEFMYYSLIETNYEFFESIRNSTINHRDIIVKDIEGILNTAFPYNDYNDLTASRMYDKIYLIQNYSFGWFYYLLIIFGYMLPNLVVFLYSKYRTAKFAHDMPHVKLSTYLLGTMDTTIKELLMNLQKVSKTYEGIFRECTDNFNSNQLTREDAIMAMSDRVNNLQFRKLCTTLKEGVKTSKEKAISILEQDIVMEDKEDMMRSEDVVEKRTWAAIGLIAICMLCMLLLLLMPFVSLFNQLSF